MNWHLKQNLSYLAGMPRVDEAGTCQPKVWSQTPLGDCAESGLPSFFSMLCVRLKVSPHHCGRGKVPPGFGFQLRRHWFQGLHSFSSHHVSPSGPVLYLRRPLVPPKSLQQERGMFCRKASSFKQITCAQHVAITGDHAKDQYISPLRLLATGCFTKWPEVVVALFAECQSVVLQQIKNDERLNFLPAGVGLLPFNSVSLL